MAAGDGLDFRFDRTRGANTFDGHRVIQLAGGRGCRRDERASDPRVHERRRAMADQGTLVRLAARSGSRSASARRSRATSTPKRSATTSRPRPALGISAVPLFVIDRRFGAPGAQPPEVLAAFLQRGWDARSPLEV